VGGTDFGGEVERGLGLKRKTVENGGKVVGPGAGNTDARKRKGGGRAEVKVGEGERRGLVR